MLEFHIWYLGAVTVMLRVTVRVYSRRVRSRVHLWYPGVVSGIFRAGVRLRARVRGLTG